MKKALFTLAILLLAVTAKAQIKIHEDNWVSIGCLNGNFGLQVVPGGFTYLRTEHNNSFGWAILSKANNATQKHWIVENLYNDSIQCLKQQMFYVQGNGIVHCTGLVCTNTSSCMNNYSPIDKEEALSKVIGINGYYFDEDDLYTPEELENNEYVSEEAVEGMINDLEKSKVALSAENLAEVFPDAVRTDSEARLYIDYNAVVTILVEAVKQQQSEIELLRKVLEENGLMKPKKQ
jgi:hypothetical protein